MQIIPETDEGTQEVIVPLTKLPKTLDPHQLQIASTMKSFEQFQIRHKQELEAGYELLTKFNECTQSYSEEILLLVSQMTQDYIGSSLSQAAEFYQQLFKLSQPQVQVEQTQETKEEIKIDVQERVLEVIQEECFLDKKYKIKRITQSGNLVNGIKSGRWNIEVAGVDRQGGGEYVNGEKEGPWIDILSVQRGLQIYYLIGQYHNNLREGEWKYENVSNRWKFPGGLYVNGHKVGKWNDIDKWENWHQGEYVDGKQDGPWLIFNASMSKKTGYSAYKNGVKHGEFCEPNNDSWGVFDVGTYENGVRIGEWKSIKLCKLQTN